MPLLCRGVGSGSWNGAGPGFLIQWLKPCNAALSREDGVNEGRAVCAEVWVRSTLEGYCRRHTSKEPEEGNRTESGGPAERSFSC